MRLLPVTAALALLIVTTAAVYAAWTDTIKVSGTVNTGKVDVYFANPTCSDQGADPQDQDNNYANNENLDVASCAVNVKQEQNDGDNNNDILEITLDKAYPGYEVVIEFDVVNDGNSNNIPVKPDITPSNSYSDKVQLNGPTLVSGDTNGNGVLDPGEIWHYKLTITITDQAEESQTYSFIVTMDYTQWNVQQSSGG